MLFNHAFFRWMFHCHSSVCVCKSSSRIYTSGALKLQNTRSTYVSVPVVSEVSQGISDDNQQQGGKILKSCLKNTRPGTRNAQENGKKRVKWMDKLGKELVEFNEFKAREVEDGANEGENGGCFSFSRT